MLKVCTISLSHTLYHAIQSYKCLKIIMLNKIEHNSTHYNFKRFLTLNYIILVETPYEKKYLSSLCLKVFDFNLWSRKKDTFPYDLKFLCDTFSGITLNTERSSTKYILPKKKEKGLNNYQKEPIFIRDRQG